MPRGGRRDGELLPPAEARGARDDRRAGRHRRLGSALGRCDRRPPWLHGAAAASAGGGSSSSCHHRRHHGGGGIGPTHAARCVGHSAGRLRAARQPRRARLRRAARGLRRRARRACFSRHQGRGSARACRCEPGARQPGQRCDGKHGARQPVRRLPRARVGGAQGPARRAALPRHRARRCATRLARRAHLARRGRAAARRGARARRVRPAAVGGVDLHGPQHLHGAELCAAAGGAARGAFDDELPRGTRRLCRRGAERGEDGRHRGGGAAHGGGHGPRRRRLPRRARALRQWSTHGGWRCGGRRAVAAAARRAVGRRPARALRGGGGLWRRCLWSGVGQPRGRRTSSSL
mmetsp:Transcript_18200/g.52697  ORF Transcript_18200/g.52697 Transcript_18200/m.52697 type:complete len:349 (-) Transcript_18200:1206-2252(-)